MLLTQLLQFMPPPIIGLLILGRLDAIYKMLNELWIAWSVLTFGHPSIEADPFLTWIFAAAVEVAIPLGAFVTWRRTRQGHGPPRLIGHISALHSCPIAAPRSCG